MKHGGEGDGVWKWICYSPVAWAPNYSIPFAMGILVTHALLKSSSPSGRLLTFLPAPDRFLPKTGSHPPIWRLQMAYLHITILLLDDCLGGL